jgi:hypothetical protein
MLDVMEREDWRHEKVRGLEEIGTTQLLFTIIFISYT